MKNCSQRRLLLWMNVFIYYTRLEMCINSVVKVKTGQASLLNSYFREMIADIRKDYHYLCKGRIYKISFSPFSILALICLRSKNDPSIL